MLQEEVTFLYLLRWLHLAHDLNCWEVHDSIGQLQGSASSYVQQQANDIDCWLFAAQLSRKVGLFAAAQSLYQKAAQRRPVAMHAVQTGRGQRRAFLAAMFKPHSCFGAFDEVRRLGLAQNTEAEVRAALAAPGSDAGALPFLARQSHCSADLARLDLHT